MKRLPLDYLQCTIGSSNTENHYLTRLKFENCHINGTQLWMQNSEKVKTITNKKAFQSKTYRSLPQVNKFEQIGGEGP